MIPSSSLVTSLILKKLFLPVYSTQRSLRAFRVTVKRSLLNRRAPILGRELIRVNITIETDEDDLMWVVLGLLMANTAWHNGPVIEALRTRSRFYFWTRSTWHPTKSSVFSPFLEGKGVFLKKIGKMGQTRCWIPMLSLLQTQRVKVLMMVVSLAPMSLMKRF